MKDLILVKSKKSKLKEKFKQDNLSIGSSSFDSVNYFDDLHIKNIDFYNRMNYLNKILFNFLVFSVFVLSTFLIIIILSITSRIIETKNKVLNSGYSGIKALELAQDNLLKLDTENSSYYFKLAFKHFEEAELEYSKIKPVTASLSIIPIASNYQKNAKNIKDLGQRISTLGTETTEIIKEISYLKNKDPIELIQNIEKHNFLINKEIEIIEKKLSQVDTQFLDKDLASKIEKIKIIFPEAKKYFKILEDFYKKTPEIAGLTEEKNYLIVFQNNNEMRSTGGFIGSFGILKIKNGEIGEFFIDDVYTLDEKYSEAIIGGLTPYIPLPYPITSRFTGHWSLKDSNIDPDFSKTAKTIIDFYKIESKLTGDKKYPEKIDGVISITPTVLEEILNILGPITLEDYGITLNSDNLLETLQIEVESGKDKQVGKNPKTILEILKITLMEKFSTLKPGEARNIFFETIKKLDEKHIILYSENNEIQRFFSKLGWIGEIKKTENEDFLMIINNNFGGGKSSLKIDEGIEQEINIENDGSITKEVKITREHTSDYYLKYFDPWLKQEMWLVGDNNNYIKIYVPKGSKLIKAEGFANKIDIFNEDDKTAFGSNLSVKPKQKKTATLSYELPFKINKGDSLKYSLIMQKQPGSIGSNIKTKINLPADAEIKSSIGNLEKKKDTFFSGILSLDRYIYILYSL